MENQSWIYVLLRVRILLNQQNQDPKNRLLYTEYVGRSYGGFIEKDPSLSSHANISKFY